MARGSLETSTLILAGLAIACTVVAYVQNPALPREGAEKGLTLLWSVLPRLVPALILTGLLQALIPRDLVARHFGRASGLRGILMATGAGMVTPGGPLVSMPLLLGLAHSGAGRASLVAYMTSWSLFGWQRIIAWEAPMMGWRFVLVRVVPSLAFPVIAGWLVATFSPD